MKSELLTLLALGALTAGGCTTIATSSRRQAETHEMARDDRLQADMVRLQARVEGMAESRNEAFRDVEALRAQQERELAAIRRELETLRAMIKSLDAAREADRKAIVDSLSKQIAGLVKQAAPRRAYGPSISDDGLEHTVNQGETLSEIATAYGTRVDVLIRANKLSNPNAIRVGQRLFIPE